MTSIAQLSEAPSLARGAEVPVPPGPGPHHSNLVCLCAVARIHGLSADPGSLSHRLALSGRDAQSPDEILLAAQTLGLKAKVVQVGADRLQHTPLPALAAIKDGSTSRYVLLAQVDESRVLIQDFSDALPRPRIEPRATFEQRWTGALLLLASRASLVGGLARFDFSWFIPSLVKYRRLFVEVLLISTFLQLLALVSPLFFQVVIDKVLVHHGLTTLNVIVAAMVAVVIFESALSVIRSYVLAHTTCRVDVELGSKLFRHLIRLPLAYFQSRRVGDSVARVRELENIRSFLTGNALTAVLDLAFSVVFIAVMLFYSVTLTLVVLAALPVYCLLITAVVPVLRQRLTIKFARSAENQAMLVEAVSGIETIKSGALEPQFGRRWDDQLAAYVSAAFRTQSLASLGQESIAVIGKLTNAATLWWGAHLVIGGDMSVGQFVAFNMFAQRVAAPIMRIAQLWTDFQQVGVSMSRLGDVLNTRQEAHGSGQLPKIQGKVSFDQVTFRYRPDSAPVLTGLSVDVRPGEVIGIVGRSGSGKSTLTKLIQRLHVPEAGRVLIDGMDISLINPEQLRRQIGVVLQENVLFNRTIRENIAVADPSAPIDAVVAAARLAGAHEFIGELPEGYETVVGEGGGGLSGGQRQRIAIARALLTNPRILIFDEATSALDYESEAILQRNMAGICRGRTVFIIAHRLSAVRDADRIIVLEKGRVIECGSHAALTSRPEGLYKRLWTMQSAGAQGLGG